MHRLADYHHFKAAHLDPADKVARCERHVIDLLLSSRLTEDERDSSVAFELKHHAGVTQFSRLLARKRGMPQDPCTVGGLLHDIHVIVHGNYRDHAHQGAPLAQAILDDIGGFSDVECAQVHRIVFDHSDKHVWSDDPFSEFGKDADVLDCFLYPGAFDYYLRHKPLDIFREYLRRAQRVWAEVDLPPDPRFAVLDDYRADEWLHLAAPVPRSHAANVLAALLELSALGPGTSSCPPPFAVVGEETGVRFAVHDEAWETFVASLRERPGLLAELPSWSGERGDQAIFLLGALGAGEPPTAPSLVDDVARAKAAALLDGERPLLFWPAIGTYEELDVVADDMRLRAIGIRDQIGASTTA